MMMMLISVPWKIQGEGELRIQIDRQIDRQTERQTRKRNNNTSAVGQQPTTVSSRPLSSSRFLPPSLCHPSIPFPKTKTPISSPSIPIIHTHPPTPSQNLTQNQTPIQHTPPISQKTPKPTTNPTLKKRKGESKPDVRRKTRREVDENSMLMLMLV